MPRTEKVTELTKCPLEQRKTQRRGQECAFLALKHLRSSDQALDVETNQLFGWPVRKIRAYIVINPVGELGRSE